MPDWMGYIVFISIIAAAFRWERRDTRAIRDTALERGLKPASAFCFEGSSELGPLKFGRLRSGEDAVAVELKPSGIAKDLVLSRPHLMSSPEPYDGAYRTLLTAEPVLDGFAVRGPLDLVAATLNASMRATLKGALKRGDVSIRYGIIATEMASVPIIGARQALETLVDDAMHIAQAFCAADGDIAENLHDIAATDTDRAFARRAAEALWLLHAESEAAERLSVTAQRSQDPYMRVLWAHYRGGKQGQRTLLEIACSGRYPHPLRTQAVRALSPDHDDEQEVVDRLVALIPTTSRRLLCAILGWLVRRQVQIPLELLSKRVRATGPQARLAMVSCAALHGEAAATWLTERLSDPDRGVSIAAAEMLGEVGTLDGVEDLLPWTRGVSALPNLKTAAKLSIARIQARFGTDRPGGLTLEEPHANPGGTLSLDSVEVGALETTTEGT